MWCCEADYADGTHVERKVPYNEGGNYLRENERQYELECWLIGHHPDPIWWSVAYVEE